MRVAWTFSKDKDILKSRYYFLVMRSPCAGAALGPPSWIIPNKALSYWTTREACLTREYFCFVEVFVPGVALVETEAGKSRCGTIDAGAFARATNTCLSQPEVPARRHGS